MSIFEIKLKSAYLNDIAEVTIAAPDVPIRNEMSPEAFYSSDKRYKVLWLFHGGRDTLREWGAYSNITRLALKYGIFIVMPNGHDLDFVNHREIGDGCLFQDFFLKELRPFVFNWLPVSDRPEDNFLAGNSMGCSASWQYGIQYPDLFGCIAPLCNQPLDYRYLEPYRALTSSEFRDLTGMEECDVMAAYGAVGEKIHTKEINTICKYRTVGDFLDSIENTMQRFEEASAAGQLPHFWVPCGTAPRDTKLLNFKARCEALHLDNITFSVYEEQTHCFAFWEKAIAEFLKYLRLEEVNYFTGV